MQDLISHTTECSYLIVIAITFKHNSASIIAKYIIISARRINLCRCPIATVTGTKNPFIATYTSWVLEL
jgi:hypothetical protein